jgi:hypothetical protein
MKPSDPLDCHDEAPPQKSQGFVQSLSGAPLAITIHQSQGRAARRAGIGLGVESPVRRVFILPAAHRAHGEGGHGRLVPVIGDVFDNGEPGAAESAVDEGIAVTEVPGIEEFCQARFAGRHIRGDQGKPLRGPFTLSNLKERVSLRFERAGFQGFDSSKRGSPFRQPPEETVESFIVSLGIDEHAFFIVQDPAPDGMAKGQIIDKRPEPDALNNAGYFNGLSFQNPIFSTLPRGYTGLGGVRADAVCAQVCKPLKSDLIHRLPIRREKARKTL